MRNSVEAHSWNFDWSQLSRQYHRAHDLAQQRALAPAGAAAPRGGGA